LVYFLLKYLKGDVFLNSIVAAISDMTGYMVSGMFINRLGVKKSYSLYFFLGALGSVLYICFSHTNENLVPILLLFTVFGISSACMTNWLTNARLFPVLYASSSHGIASFFARLSNSLAPQVAEMEYPIPLYFIVGLCVTGAIASQKMNTRNLDK
jgi:hypothetical protein